MSTLPLASATAVESYASRSTGEVRICLLPYGRSRVIGDDEDLRSSSTRALLRRFNHLCSESSRRRRNILACQTEDSASTQSPASDVDKVSDSGFEMF
ncbi:hypothetical protein E4U14_007748 [Claviceps sp. LM454 group G7]|nr:hypothetical protein E4U14_007748 [Claviceps sp. LM454 group G7]